MKDSILIKNKQQTKTSSASTTRNELDVASFTILGSMGFISAFIGGGALICFISASVNAGPLELLKGFISAITGI